MKKLLLGALLGALIGAIGLYVYQKTAHRSGAPAGPAETAESALAAASKGSADTGAVLRKVKMTGAVLTVKDGESIQAAVSKAKPGDTIQVMPGLYKETVYIDKDNIAIVGVIGINRSPSCGVETTSNHDEEVAGQGLFFAALKQELDARGISLPMIGIKANEPERAIEAVSRLLGE